MAKIAGKEPNTTTTDFSWADQWIEDRRIPKYIRIQVKYPLTTDRKSGNVDFASQELHRTWRGKAPNVEFDPSNLSIQPTRDMYNQKYIYINPVPNVGHVPQGYRVTTSGMEPLPEDFVPFEGDPTDNPTQVDCDFDNSTTSGAGEFYYVKNVCTLNMAGDRYPYKHSYDPNVGRLSWNIVPEFDNPTEPEVRYPKQGAKRAKKFRNW